MLTVNKQKTYVLLFFSSNHVGPDLTRSELSWVMNSGNRESLDIKYKTIYYNQTCHFVTSLFFFQKQADTK